MSNKIEYSLEFLAGAYGPESKIPLLEDLIGRDLLEVVVIGYSKWKEGSPSGIFQNNGINLPHSYHNDLLCEFCQKIRSTQIGCNRCMASDCEAIRNYTGGVYKEPIDLIKDIIKTNPIKHIKKYRKQQTFCYQCHAGLLEIIRPINIKIDDTSKATLPIGCIWSGQHRIRNAPLKSVKKLAEEIGYIEPDELVNIYKLMQPRSESDIFRYVHNLHEVATSIEKSATNTFHARKNVFLNFLGNEVLSILRKPLDQLAFKAENSIINELSDSLSSALRTIVETTGNCFSVLFLLPNNWENEEESELLICTHKGAVKYPGNKYIRFKKEYIDEILNPFEERRKPSIKVIGKPLIEGMFLQKIKNAFGVPCDTVLISYIPLLENVNKALLWIILFSEQNNLLATKHTVLPEAVQMLKNLTETMYHIYNVVGLVLQNIKQLEDLKKSEQTLKQNEKATILLIHNIAHQVTRPIVELRQSAYLFSSQGFSADAYKYFKAALAEVERGTRNFSNYELLTTDFKKLLSGIKIQNRIDLLEIFEKAKERISPYLEVDQRKIYVDTKGISLPRISGNIDAFVECLVNVLHNAIKYSLGGRPIEIEIDYARNRKEIEMKVANYGVELKREDWEEIFHPTKRSETAKSLAIEGAGLGLYIAREFIKLHQGSVKVETCEPSEPLKSGRSRWKTVISIIFKC